MGETDLWVEMCGLSYYAYFLFRDKATSVWTNPSCIKPGRAFDETRVNFGKLDEKKPRWRPSLKLVLGLRL